MGRLRRAVDDGLVYHAPNRRDNLTAAFADDDGRLAFLQAPSIAKEDYPLRLIGYCLMTHYLRFVLRPEPGQSISRILRCLTVADTRRYHKRHRSSGHVRQGRFKSPMIQDGLRPLVVLRSIGASPLRARMVADPAGYRRSRFQDRGLRHDDPLLSPFPGWEDRMERERRRWWLYAVPRSQAESHGAGRSSTAPRGPHGIPLGRDASPETIANIQ
jgi:putative transposase